MVTALMARKPIGLRLCIRTMLVTSHMEIRNPSRIVLEGLIVCDPYNLQSQAHDTYDRPQVKAQSCLGLPPSAKSGFKRPAAYGLARPCHCRWSSCCTTSVHCTETSSCSAVKRARFGWCHPVHRQGQVLTPGDEC